MDKIKTFIRTFWKSISDPDYYREILLTKFSFSLKYLFFLLFLISFIQGVPLVVRGIRFIPQIPQFKEDLKINIRQFYPEELKITFTGKKIKTNVEEPYVIGFITIDSKGAVEDYAKYKTAVLVTDSLIIVPDNQAPSSYKVLLLEDLLKNVPDGSVLDKKVYTGIAESLFPYLNYLTLAVGVAIVLALLVWPFVGAALGLSWQMLGLLLFALIVLIAAKIMKKSLSYKDIYRLSMHGITIPILLSLLFTLPGFSLGIINILIFLVFMIFVISKFETKPQS